MISPKSVAQQIKPTAGNSNDDAAFSKSGNQVVKQVGSGSNNPATSGNNPPDALKRKVNVSSRKF